MSGASTSAWWKKTEKREMVKSREGERAEKSICLDLSLSSAKPVTKSCRRTRHCRSGVLANTHAHTQRERGERGGRERREGEREKLTTVEPLILGHIDNSLIYSVRKMATFQCTSLTVAEFSTIDKMTLVSQCIIIHCMVDTSPHTLLQ